MSKKRSLSVDIAKGVSIIAIVLGHINFAYPSYRLADTRALIFGLWHVAAFFLLAGFFIKEELLVQPKLLFKKKFSSLYCISISLLYCFIIYLSKWGGILWIPQHLSFMPIL